MTSNYSIFHVDMNFVCLREDFLRSLLHRVGDAGYNAILWEPEDKVQWETCPQVVWPEAMTKSQFRSILKESREMGLEPIPLLQTVGHGEYVMKHPDYADLREQPDRTDCYCTTNPNVRKFLRQLTSEYMDLFGDLNHFHFGGDEAGVFATCSRCKAAAERQGANALYAEHILDVATPALEAGIAPGIWSDMVMHHPEQVGAIDRRFVLWDWNYWDGTKPPKAVRVWGERGMKAAEQIDDAMKQKIPELLDNDGNLQSFYAATMLKRLGFDVIVCSSVRCAGGTVFCPMQARHAANIVGAAQKTTHDNLLGHCVTSWAIRVFSPDLHELELTYEPAARANPDIALEDILQKTGEAFFGVSPAGYYEAAKHFAAPFAFATGGASRGGGIQWNGLKDGTTPPKGYVAHKLNIWRSENGGAMFDQIRREVAEAGESISIGVQKMMEFAPTVTTERGKHQVAQWLIAGRMQWCMNQIVSELFDVFQGKPTQPVATTTAALHVLKDDFESWANGWMTPQSARHNAHLIFDHLIAYFTVNTLATDA